MRKAKVPLVSPVVLDMELIMILIHYILPFETYFEDGSISEKLHFVKNEIHHKAVYKVDHDQLDQMP